MKDLQQVLVDGEPEYHHFDEIYGFAFSGMGSRTGG